jgi:long-subunit acyl-CoA synthetase (AMP-forming)
MLDESTPISILETLIPYTDIDMLWGDEEVKEAMEPFLTSGVCHGRDKILFFTSGTNDRSKAVVLTGHSLCQSAYNGGALLPLSCDDTLMCMLPLGHVFGFVCGLLWGLSCGACAALGRGARHYVDDLSFYEPTALSAVPMLLGFLLKQELINSRLRLVLIGAGGCSPELLNAVFKKGLKVSFGYGLTETSSGVALSIGGDPYAMDVCPDDSIILGEDGEILIKSPTCMMKEYYKQPEATRNALKNGVLYTGDLGRFDESGKLHVTGRKKEILVLEDGTKIYLPEYESVLSKALGTSEMAVILKNGRPCMAYFGDQSKQDLWRVLTPLMEDYPRNHQIADIIILNTPLPRTATGKIKRWELEKLVKD